MPWHSRWFASDKDYAKLLLEDIRLRRSLDKKFALAGVQNVEIERLPRAISIRMQVSRPGIVIGRGGTGIEEARTLVLRGLNLQKDGPRAPKIEIIVEEVKNPDLSAKLVAGRIVLELERRLPQRRVVNKTMDRVMASGAKGIKVTLSGRIAGADIARHEKYQRGSMPTQSLRANIDYAHIPALLKRGYVGVKVWIHRPPESQTS